MKPVSGIALTGQKLLKQHARESLALENYDLSGRVNGNRDLFEQLRRTTVGSLDKKIKGKEHLTFEEAFCGMCYVLAATNLHFFEAHLADFEQANGGGFSRERALALAVVFMTTMANKEIGSFLTPEEIAGVVAAAMMDTVISVGMPRMIETCGMGGDKGFAGKSGSKKSINASTLSALVLASLGLPAVKHGSYANTSSIGSTETIELFGANTSMTSHGQVRSIMAESGFCFFDAHWCKTIHDLSHLIMMETINHIIGPMTPPVDHHTQINKVMGVNSHVHPASIAKAYALLHKMGKQNIGGIIAICGLDESGKFIDVNDLDAVREHTVIDEVSPFASVISATLGDKHLGTWMITPEDFGVSINPGQILVANDRETIHQANIAALCDINPHLADYLAINAALGLYAIEYLHLEKGYSSEDGLNPSYLYQAFCRCREAIASGAAKRTLASYVQASGGTLILDS